MLVQKSSRASLSTVSPTHAGLAELASEGRLREIVEVVSIPRSYTWERADNRKIARWIAARFAELGLRTSLDGRYENVVAMTPSAAERPAVLVGAHYDSISGCPGADDNASAVAAALHSAEVLLRHDRDLPLCFVAFNREEDGLKGSADFVRRFLPRSPLRLRLAHVLEMVGYRDLRPGSQRVPWGLPVRLPKTGDFLALLADRHSRRAVTRVLRLARTCYPDFPVMSLKVYLRLERLFPVLLRSDHASFWSRDIPALLWTDTSEYRNPNYHQATDVPQTLDYAYLKRVTQLLVIAALDELETRVFEQEK